MLRLSTLEDYQQRIGRVVGHIERNLDEDCSLDAMARLAAFSPCHFHRIFRALTGEGVAEHTRRLRLQRAAMRLSTTDRPVVDIAFEAGYEAHESFTRAFESFTGLPPARYRTEKSVLTAPDLDSAITDIPGTLEHIGPLPLMRLRHLGPYQDVGASFGRLAAWLGPRGGFGPWTRSVGLCYDDPDVTDPSRIRYDAAYVVNRPLEPGGGIEFYELPAGDYVTALHRGPYTGLSLSYAGLYRHWLRNGSTGIADGPTLEFYLNHPGDTEPDSLLTRICIPLGM